MTDWTDEALCAQTDPEAFFPEDGQSAGPAKRICRKCPVLVECLDDAIRSGEWQFGVRGGMTAQERRRMRRDAA